MRNLHKLLIAFISVAFFASGVFAQNTELSPKLQSQLEKNAQSELILQKQAVVDALEYGGNNPAQLVSPYAPEFNVKGDALDCPEGSIFDYSCVGYANGNTAEADPGYTVYQYYDGVTSSIGSVTFWGINAWFDGAAWVACSEDPMEFNIGFYGDNAGQPDEANVLSSYTESLTAFPTGELFAGAYEIFRYTLDIPGGGVNYTDAWVGVQGAGDANCWFLWVDSGTLGTLAYQSDGAALTQLGASQTLCLGPGGPALENDIGVSAIVSPVSGVFLTSAEEVTIDITNYGTVAQSNFDVDFTLDGGAAVTETITATINGGESYTHTFGTTVDLSVLGDYDFTSCTYLAADENTANDCKDKMVSNNEPVYCDATTTNEDEYIGQVICGDIDNTTGWQGGVGDYTEMSTMIVPAASEDITVINGGNPYTTDAVSCWVDWNDDYVFELGGEEEFILTSDGTGASFTGAITAPATAVGGEHRMRVRMVYSSVPDPCGVSAYGEVEDYTIFVGGLDFGNVMGNVSLTGTDPYNMGDVMEVLVMGGSFMTYPDASGDYDLEIYPGTYDMTATLYGYAQQIVADVIVDEGGTVTGIDFVLPSVTGRIMGTVTDVDTGDPIEGAEVSVVGTEMMVLTAADGTYEIFITEGTYNVKANHANYGAQTMEDVEVMAEMDTTVDFALGFAESCMFSVELWDDYGDGWNGNTLTVSVDGEVILDNIGLEAGTGPESWDLEVGSGSLVTCVYVGTAGQWDYENYYFIYNNDDEVVFSDGEGGVPPVGGSFDATCIVFIYGDLEGMVTDEATGDPIEGAMVMIDDLSGTTAADGTYLIEDVMIGTWDVYCEAVGYNTAMAPGVEIFEELVTVQDFVLSAPDFVVDPLVIDESLEIGETTDVMVNIENPGLGTVDWSAGLAILTDGTDDAWDLQMSFDVDAQTGAAGNAGAECDGEHYYSTRWASNLLHQYDMDGNLVAEFSIPGVSGLRDLAYDGTYFYGGAASSTIYEMDFDNLTLVSSISNSGEARSIAYDEGYDAFWVSNFGSNVLLIDKSGATLETITNASIGLTGMYGSAYDNWSAGGPYLWLFDQGAGAGTAQLVHQIDLNTLAPSGFTFDVMTDLGPNASAIAGGLFTIENVYAGTVSLGGLLQGTPDTYFMFELTGYSTWITIDPTSGSLAAGTNEDMTVHLDATEITIPGVYEAEIHFTTTPDVGTPVVDVTLTVAGLIPAINLTGDYDCTDVMLMWEMPTGGTPDSWNVYRDGTLLGSATAMEYTDEMLMPETDYIYSVTAVYGGDESMATPDFMISFPIPEDLEPLNPEAMADTPNENDVTVTWDAPDACVAPDGYNVYRDGSMINTSLVTGMEFVDPALSAGLYEYKVMAVYYFGDSDFSGEAYALITGINDLDASMFEIFPNPATDVVTVNSPYEINSIRVLNNAGQSVLDYEVNAASYQLDVSDLQSGIYFIRIETEEGQTLQKIAVK